MQTRGKLFVCGSLIASLEHAYTRTLVDAADFREGFYDIEFWLVMHSAKRSLPQIGCSSRGSRTVPVGGAPRASGKR